MPGSWLLRPPREHARIRLFCFPPGGFGASFFREWESDLPAAVDVLPLQLPGLETRSDEEPADSMAELVDSAVAELRNHLAEPFAVFGHSMGGILAHAFVSKVVAESIGRPEAMFLAGCRPPHLDPTATEDYNALDDDELIDTLIGIGSIPAVFRTEQELLLSRLPALRAGAKARSNYRFRPSGKLAIPTTTFAAEDDAVVSPEEMRRWDELTAGPVRHHVFPGDHMFVRAHRRELLGIIESDLHLAAEAEPVPTWRPSAGRDVEPIAIVGMACRFPGASSLREYWTMLDEAVDAVSQIPPDRFDIEKLYAPVSATPGRASSRWGGFLDDIAGFDATFFGISYREARSMDPQQRLLLEVTWEALQDAGVTAGSLAGSRTGVYVGQMEKDYWDLQKAGGDIGFYELLGSGAGSVPSGRLSYALDLRGPCLTIDTGCSSSLITVHLACQSIWSGESKMALAGGSQIILSPHENIATSQARMLAPDGRCKFGDASANGIVLSEGVAMVVLKPLSQAVADQDRVYAVIMSSVTNNDGRSSGQLASPAQSSQESLVREALAAAGISGADVDYVEAHGAGTQLGDGVELRALGSVIGRDRPADRPCLVGSVKTNIGHTEAASGAAGLIKTVLSLHHGRVPATLHLRTLNPALDWDTLGLKIASTSQPLPRRDGPAIAGVSSFGLTGSNAHVILRQPQPVPVLSAPASPAVGANRTLLLPVSARSPQALGQLAGAMADQIESAQWAVAARACAAAARRRDHHRYRIAVSASDPHDLAEALRAAGRAIGPDTGGAPARVAFVFPGQGSQWHGMGRDLFTESSVFRSSIEECDAAISAVAGFEILGVFDGTVQADDHEVVQPALWALQVGLARLWQSWGIRPDLVIGHSMGEVAAAHVAGALDLASAASVICRRSRLAAGSGGGLAVVGMSADDLTPWLTARSSPIHVAAYNSPTSTVLTGDRAELAELVAALESQDHFARLVQVDVAAHSPAMDPVRGRLVESLAGLRPATGAVPFHSTVRGCRVEGAELDAEYWGDNIRQPVKFVQAVQSAADEGPVLFLELSAHPTLGLSIRETLGDSTEVITSLTRDRPAGTTLSSGVAKLYEHGYEVDWNAVFPGPCPHSDLPLYPWQHEQLWFESAGISRTGGKLEPSPGIDQPADLSVLSPQDRTSAPDLEEFLKQQVQAVLHTPADRLSAHEPLTKLGMDSLLALELRNRLRSGLEVDIRLSVLLGGVTLAGLAAQLESAHGEPASEDLSSEGV